ncbi:MAG: tetratricopeptide repeat protein [Longimicrobiaceae bacterium]
MAPPRPRTTIPRALAVAAAILGAAASPGAAQSGNPAVAEALALRDARDFAGAAAALRRHLAEHPDDGEALRLLAQTLYWNGEREPARGVYEQALALHPEDTRLRLDYARMLAETGDARRAQAVLGQVTAEGSAGAEAETLRGTLAYWSGDPATAAERFRAALRLDPRQDEARRRLGEVHAAAAPRARVAASARRDGQPLRRAALAVEAEWHPALAHALSLRAEPQRYDAGGVEASLLQGEVGVRSVWPGGRVETELTAGGVRRAAGADWTGRAAVGVRLPAHLVARVRAERAPYLWTAASLDEPVTTRTGAVLLEWSDPRGWAGQLGAAVDRYPDDNQVRSAHAWVLAPVVRTRAAKLRLGYGFGAQDADESRWVPLAGAPPSGAYAPYYTPAAVRSHSLAGAMEVAVGGFALHAGGAYGVAAREDAPFATGGPGTRPGWYPRSFHPWSARAQTDVRLAPGASLALEAEHFRTAFYDYTAGSVAIVLRRLPRAGDGATGW